MIGTVYDSEPIVKFTSPELILFPYSSFTTAVKLTSS